jgi:hypothetical protein
LQCLQKPASQPANQPISQSAWCRDCVDDSFPWRAAADRRTGGIFIKIAGTGPWFDVSELPTLVGIGWLLHGLLDIDVAYYVEGLAAIGLDNIGL